MKISTINKTIEIVKWDQLSPVQKEAALARPKVINDDQQAQVQAIIDRVKIDGDTALRYYTKQFDCADLMDLGVSQAELRAAPEIVSDQSRQAITIAASRIANYQRQCLPKPLTIDTQDGIRCQRLARPIERVGLYVPGGSAPLVSTLLMLAIPAQVAKCPQVVLCTPPNPNGEINPLLLQAANLCGVKTLCKIGGAQAIAAMAYGTDSVPKVDKIFGPGNVWVTTAKQIVAQDQNAVAIDLPAGPSELLLIADNEANAEYVATDLLSQAEHGPDSQVLLVTTSPRLAVSVSHSIASQLDCLSRKSISNQALGGSRIIVVNSIDQALMISNQYAPEHLSLQIADAEAAIPRVRNAGAVFIGRWTAETLGDYITGANHVLPTAGYARSYSGLSVIDYMKYISVQTATANGLQKLGPLAMELAVIEGLDAHCNAVAVRLCQQPLLTTSGEGSC